MLAGRNILNRLFFNLLDIRLISFFIWLSVEFVLALLCGLCRDTQNEKAEGKGDYSHDRGGVERANRLLIADIGETKHDNCCTECRSQRYDPLNFGTALFFFG